MKWVAEAQVRAIIVFGPFVLVRWCHNSVGYVQRMTDRRGAHYHMIADQTCNLSGNHILNFEILCKGSISISYNLYIAGLAKTMSIPSNYENRPFPAISSGMLSPSSTIDACSAATAVASCTTTTESSFETRATRLTSSSAITGSQELVREQMAHAQQYARGLQSNQVFPSGGLPVLDGRLEGSVMQHENGFERETHHSQQHSSSEKTKDGPGGGIITTKESTTTTHTTKKSSLTMRTKLNKRPSLLSCDLLGIKTMLPLEEVERGLKTFEDLERIGQVCH